MFFKSKIFRKDIEPFCVYCKMSNSINARYCTCTKRGVVEKSYSCRHFTYDPLKREPKKPALLKTNFSDEDFKL